MNTQIETVYILGHSSEESRRLMAQAEILRPITKRFLFRSSQSEKPDHTGYAQLEQS